MPEQHLHSQCISVCYTCCVSRAHCYLLWLDTYCPGRSQFPVINQSQTAPPRDHRPSSCTWRSCSCPRQHSQPSGRIIYPCACELNFRGKNPIPLIWSNFLRLVSVLVYLKPKDLFHNASLIWEKNLVSKMPKRPLWTNFMPNCVHTLWFRRGQRYQRISPENDDICRHSMAEYDRSTQAKVNDEHIMKGYGKGKCLKAKMRHSETVSLCQP